MRKITEHVASDGKKVTHCHTHTHAATASVKRRLKNIIGHTQGILNMVEEGRDCSDVLIQLSAISSSIKKLRRVVLKDHIEHCIYDAVKYNDRDTFDKLKDAIERMGD